MSEVNSEEIHYSPEQIVLSYYLAQLNLLVLQMSKSLYKIEKMLEEFKETIIVEEEKTKPPVKENVAYG